MGPAPRKHTDLIRVLIEAKNKQTKHKLPNVPYSFSPSLGPHGPSASEHRPAPLAYIPPQVEAAYPSGPLIASKSHIQMETYPPPLEYIHWVYLGLES